MPVPSRFQKVEEDILFDHARLTPQDQCYFLAEYTAGRNWEFGNNGLITNLKKKPQFKDTPSWKYKKRAISDCAVALGRAIGPAWLRGGTLIPVPPSKAKDDPEYDDRMTQVLTSINIGFPVDVRELVIQTQSLRRSHASGENRVTVDELLDVYQIDESLADPAPTAIAVVDDVLTAGTHYKAMQTILSQRFPDIPIFGIFIARRVFANDSAADFDIIE